MAGGGPSAAGRDLPGHNGVLFLDELPEFDKSAMETLRQPLEDGVVTITRASGSLTLPSPLSAGVRHEPLPLRVVRPPGPALHLLGQAGGELPAPRLRPAAGPDRPARERSLRGIRRPAPQGNAGVLGRDPARGWTPHGPCRQPRFEGTGASCNAYMTPPDDRAASARWTRRARSSCAARLSGWA